jgi:hypothetical protein
LSAQAGNSPRPITCSPDTRRRPLHVRAKRPRPVEYVGQRESLREAAVGCEHPVEIDADPTIAEHEANPFRASRLERRHRLVERRPCSWVGRRRATRAVSAVRNLCALPLALVVPPDEPATLQPQLGGNRGDVDALRGGYSPSLRARVSASHGRRTRTPGAIRVTST